MVSPSWRVRRCRFDALRRCCSGDCGAKRKTSDNLRASPISAHRPSDPVEFYAGKQDAFARVGGGDLRALARGGERGGRIHLSELRVRRNLRGRCNRRELQIDGSRIGLDPRRLLNGYEPCSRVQSAERKKKNDFLEKAGGFLFARVRVPGWADQVHETALESPAVKLQKLCDSSSLLKCKTWGDQLPLIKASDEADDRPRTSMRAGN